MELTAKDWERIDELVDTLGISIDEAKQMLLDDKAIDKGEKLFELADDLKAGAKKARQADRKVGERKNTRKEDTDKTLLMNLLMGAVENCSPTQTKPGEFIFEYNDRKFKVVLSAPRSWGADFSIEIFGRSLTSARTDILLYYTPHQFVKRKYYTK